MKTTIPDELKAAVPQTKWGKILTATPVIMTVIATMLAGLSSSEMTRAQYDRSLAAQQQSKAGDQWGYFQAKRLRSALQNNTLDLLEATADVHLLDAAVLQKLAGDVDAPTLAALQTGKLPAVPTVPAPDAAVKAALAALQGSRPEREIEAQLAKVRAGSLTATLSEAQADVQAFDQALEPVNQAIARLEKAVPPTDRVLSRDYTFARLRYTAARYDAEARMNQLIANLYELQVRKNNVSAERHHRRSGRFFYGMLAAQAAVIVSTFSLAAQRRSMLWSLAAAAGLAAIAFAIYVYFYV